MFNTEPKVPQISVEDVKKSLDAQEKVILLDVRTTSEFDRGRIEKSINLPVQDVSSDIEKVIPDKKQKVYVYCLSGSRSTEAVGEMMQKGYTNVYNITSGLLAWRVHKYPTI